MPNGDLKKYLRDSRPLSLNRQAVRPPPGERVIYKIVNFYRRFYYHILIIQFIKFKKLCFKEKKWAFLSSVIK